MSRLELIIWYIVLLLITPLLMDFFHGVWVGLGVIE